MEWSEKDCWIVLLLLEGDLNEGDVEVNFMHPKDNSEL